MFRLDNNDDYTCLQAHVNINESIQPAMVVGGFIVIDLVANVFFIEGEDDGINNH
jgi:hypothetical protein